MKAILLSSFLCIFVPFICDSYKVLAIFPYNGRSHHILFSTFVEELAARDHEELQYFLDNAENGVVYISFGSVAHHFPSHILQEIMAFVQNTKMKIVWKVDHITDKAVPKNLLVRKWFPQPAILCHPKVVAFVTHSGMLSTTEAMHCGVPVIAVPLFGDQFSNAVAASENGLGVVLDIYTLDRNILGDGLRTVLEDSYQTRAKELSKIWRDRPLSAMDTAVFWIEYVARHQGTVNMKPSTVQLNIVKYLMMDIVFLPSIFIIVIIYTVNKLLRLGVSQKHKTRKID